jgi:hypothetical protein
VVFNLEQGGFAATGQNVVAVVNLATNAGSIFFFTDAISIHRTPFSPRRWTRLA